MSGRFVRLAEGRRTAVPFTVDGHPATALSGDTLLVALLHHGKHVRQSEFGDGRRAGFCLMGACQDCWVRTEDGARLRACTTVVTEGVRIVTQPADATWPNAA
ncbi:MAG TPA: (2Fe-2S)-binding protein [Burkholderiaceae bacterium]|nr:(2Fe-2S)-binding protein [Burkholderiaceae bacterium]